MTIMNRKSVVIGLFAALIAIAPGVHAQDSSGGGETSFDDEQIESFTTARADVRELQQEYAPKIQQADQEKAAQLKQEAQKKMVSAVEDAGLDVQEFNSIARAAQNDQELAKKIQNAAE
ncbi:MAG: DUF4168 domain-containing protein [Halofilum sp. (in: g-proteobacteria)]